LAGSAIVAAAAAAVVASAAATVAVACKQTSGIQDRYVQRAVLPERGLMRMLPVMLVLLAFRFWVRNDL